MKKTFIFLLIFAFLFSCIAFAPDLKAFNIEQTEVSIRNVSPEIQPDLLKISISSKQYITEKRLNYTLLTGLVTLEENRYYINGSVSEKTYYSPLYDVTSLGNDNYQILITRNETGYKDNTNILYLKFPS